MNIGVAQIQSLSGKVDENIDRHMAFIKHAISLQTDFLVFPELSITNYDPTLARQLATTIKNAIFTPFQQLADVSNICIAIGMPTKSQEQVYISQLIFKPNMPITVYSKGILHPLESPFFSSGKCQPIVTIHKQTLGIGICYESLQKEHFLKAKERGAAYYLASVAKPKAGIDKALAYFSDLAKTYKTPIFMSNCIGRCGKFMSYGHSSIWNEKGLLLAQLTDKEQGLLVYNSILKTVTVKPIEHVLIS